MIPTPYSTLPGFRTVYTETDLFQAIAISEVMAANGQGGSSPGGSTLAAQNAQTAILTTTDGSAFNTNIAVNNISQILSRPVTSIAGSVANVNNNLLIAGQLGNRIYLTELTICGRAVSPIDITVSDTLNNTIWALRLPDGGNVVKIYPAGREFRMEIGSGLRIQGNLVNYTYCIGYFIAP